jgi:hypothetical protein
VRLSDRLPVTSLFMTIAARFLVHIFGIFDASLITGTHFDRVMDIPSPSIVRQAAYVLFERKKILVLARDARSTLKACFGKAGPGL